MSQKLCHIDLAYDLHHGQLAVESRELDTLVFRHVLMDFAIFYTLLHASVHYFAKQS